MATVDNDAYNLYLLLELRPGKDIINKFVMNDKAVKNIIIHESFGNFVIFSA